MNLEKQIGIIGFREFMWQYCQQNKKIILILTAILITEFIAFKTVYPFPNFMPPDSNYYLQAAIHNQFINLWPIGYSKFLRLFNCFSSSDTTLVALQYILLYASLLYFVFSFHYMLFQEYITLNLILSIIVLGPLLLHLSNFVSSDSLFASASLIWLGQLLWLIKYPSLKLIIYHAVILLFAFATRFSAIYYPLISIMAVMLTRFKIPKKIASIAIVLLPTSWFVYGTMNEYKKQVGKAQFSAFSGWQLAANSLYGYARVSNDLKTFLPERFWGLHTLVNRHMDSIKATSERPDLDIGIYYMWDNRAPLKTYLRTQMHGHTDNVFLQLASVAPLYSQYGYLMIKRHPVSYIKYYLWPNVIKYYSPPSGFLGFYNMGDTTVEPIATYWFNWKSNTVYTLFGNKEIKIVKYYSVLFSIINLALPLSIISAYILLRNQKATINNCHIILLTSIWTFNLTFSVFAAPIELRYQLFQLILTMLLTVCTTGFLLKNISTLKPVFDEYA